MTNRIGIWKKICAALIITLVPSAWIPVQARTDTNVDKTRIEFRSGSTLIFDQPLKHVEEKTFGPGWKKAVFVDAYGSQTPLFPMEFFAAMGGVIFARGYGPRISPSGKYAVLDVLRAGVVDPGPSGMAENSSKQYCPVLNIASGCVVSMQTGELCGGDWSEKSDIWVVAGYRYNATKPMIDSEFSGANDLWGQFVKSMQINDAAKIKQYLVSNLGVTNLMVCEPPTPSNKNSYTLIARQLRKEGDRSDATYIEKKLATTAISANLNQVVTIKVDKAYLYDIPDSKTQTKMYLVRGDAVKILEKSEDWARIEYVRINGAVIDKWIQFISIQ
ncbi:hypothetical protein [Caballeronia sordidicola]|jgi:hypothetical protein|uniref:hypothetical protein n=1 Tax=Caballeronia sordidicola TaxID=196367 RepID=UPI00117C0AB8|nr:hypothetical protein [Caballeronia sordidicola]